MQIPKKDVTGYRVMMPPGWDRIPLKSKAETQDAIKGIVDRAVTTFVDSSAPREKVTQARVELHTRLSRTAADAGRRNGIDIYIPVEPIHGYLAPASFLVSKVHPGNTSQVTPSETMSHLTKDFGPADDINLDGVDGVRCERRIPANPEDQESTPSRQVNYVVPVPDPESVSEWMVISFTTLTPEDVPSEFPELLIELFDAAMTTFRWSTA